MKTSFLSFFFLHCCNPLFQFLKKFVRFNYGWFSKELKISTEKMDRRTISAKYENVAYKLIQFHICLQTIFTSYGRYTSEIVLSSRVLPGQYGDKPLLYRRGFNGCHISQHFCIKYGLSSLKHAVIPSAVRDRKQLSRSKCIQLCKVKSQSVQYNASCYYLTYSTEICCYL